MPVRRLALIFAAFALLMGLVPGALGDPQPHVEALCREGVDRSAGSAAAAGNAAYIAEQLERLTGRRALRQPFLLALPVVDVCEAVVPGGLPSEALPFGEPAFERIPISPLMPSGGQAAALPPERATAELLYAGAGTLEDLKGHAVAHRIVALEATSEAGAWERAASLGASAILFLGDGRTANADLLDKATSIPLGIPRFYCDDAAAVARIRARAIPVLSIHVRISWREKTVENVVCILPGKQTTPGLAGVHDQKWVDQLVVLQARYDGASEILGRAPGACQAMNAGILLDLAGRIAAAPDHCTVLFLFTAGDQWNLRGTRAFLDLLNRDLKTAALATADLQKQVAGVETSMAAAAAQVNALVGVSRGDFSFLAAGDARAVLGDEFLREMSTVEDRLEGARLKGSASAAAAAFENEQQSLRTAANLLGGDVRRSVETEARIQAAASALLPSWNAELAHLKALHEALLPWPALRHDIGDRTPLLMLSLAVTPGSSQLGLFSRSSYDALDFTGPMAVFAQAFRRYAAMPEAGAFTVDSLENRFTLETFFPTDVAFSSDASLLRGQAAGALATIEDPAPFFDTPNDTAGNLLFSWDNITRQERAITALLIGNAAAPGAVTDPFFYGRTDIANLTADQSVTLFEHAAGETLPRLRAAGALIGGQAFLDDKPLGPALAGTRRSDWYLTDVHGGATFRSAVRIPSSVTRMPAFEFGPDGVPERTLIANSSDTNGLAADFFPDPGHPIRSMLFDCVRLDAFNLFDPRYLDTLDSLSILDARRSDQAQASNVYVDAAAGNAAVFFPPGIRWQMLAGRGDVGNRMVLINADAAHPSGQGFATTDLAEIGPLPYRSALDLYTLNERRKSDLERFGISNEVITQLHAAALPQIEAASAALQDRDYPALFAATDAAWALESQVYQNLIDTSNGIIHGIIFLLLGIIPFSYFLERLLIGAPTINKQIAWFAGIFVAMTALLWGHPAFRISSAPLMILLAFLILILSTTVVYILYGKFEEEVAILRGSASAVHSTSLRRAAVLGAAIRLGLSNMRRRGTRTALTLVTLILLTFTLLCFTSVREAVQISPRVVAPPADLLTPPPGMLLRQRAWAALPSASLNLAAELARAAGHGAAPQVAGRWWYASEKAEQPWILPIVALPELPDVAQPQTPVAFNASAFLGLDSQEAEFHTPSIDRVLTNFSVEVAAGNSCWLPRKAQALLSVNVGDRVSILGYRLRVAGFFDGPAFLTLRQLNGDPLSPVDPAGGALVPTGNANNNPGASARAESATRFLDPETLVVVPSALVRKLGGRLTSIMMRPGPSSGDLDRVAFAFAQRSAFTLYLSDGKQIRSINASQSSTPQNISDVLIPMILAGVIVLNTMLGAVSERTREIHVYTSVGLAPSHVGMLFLAEAAALGTVGVVFGFIVGQGAAAILAHTHLLPGIDLNYSSTSAITTMGLVLGIVMVSALWPARAATRLAVPSLQRDWKLPKPVGDVLAVDLPFTVNETAARGVLAFLEEFLLTTSQSGAGHFTVDNLSPLLENPTHLPRREIRGLFARVWLAPYDLGVIQTMRLTIHPTEEAHVFDVHVQLTREAGNPGTWRRLNRPFLVEIRKQFLLWRSVEPDLIKHYLQRSEMMFEPPRHQDTKNQH